METQAYWEQLISRSVSRFFLLAALAQEPMHGYQIGKAVEEATGACCSPSAAMIYPALRELIALSQKSLTSPPVSPSPYRRGGLLNLGDTPRPPVGTEVPCTLLTFETTPELMEGGYITCEVERTGTRERKVCTLTPKGRQVYEAAATAWQRVLPSIQQAVQAALISDQDGTKAARRA